jgi:hypothetical protein
VVVVALAGKVLVLLVDRVVVVLPTAEAQAVLQINQVANHKAAQDLVIVAETVSIVPLEVTYGAVVVAVLVLKAVMHSHSLAHRKVLRAEQVELIVSTGHHCIGQVVVVVVLGTEVVGAMAVMVVAVVALAVLAAQEHLELTAVVTDRISPHKQLVP